jgi:hypothetical protein
VDFTGIVGKPTEKEFCNFTILPTLVVSGMIFQNPLLFLVLLVYNDCAETLEQFGKLQNIINLL